MKVAVVTGGGTGIGKASALALAREGYSVMIAGRRPEPLDATVKQATDAGGQMRSMVADVSDPAVVKSLFAEVKQRFDSPDEWLQCSVRDRKFTGAGGPLNLAAIIETFLTWAGES